MARTKQKQIKCSKGMIADELSERTDLALLDASCLDLTNYTATIYGGFRTRRGTEKIGSYVGINNSTPYAGSVVSVIGNGTHLQDGTAWKSDPLLKNRVLFSLDFGDRMGLDGYFFVENIQSNGGVQHISAGSGSGSVTLPAGVYTVTVVGGGGASYAFSENHDKWWNGYSLGSSGAGYQCQADLAKGTYRYVAGTGGKAYGDNGDASQFYAGNTLKIQAGGGYSAKAWDGDGWTISGGKLSVTNGGLKRVSTKVYANGANGAFVWDKHGSWSNVKGKGLFSNDWGRSGTVEYAGSKHNAAYAGCNGYVGVQSVFLFIPIRIQASTDGENWIDLATMTLNQTPQTQGVVLHSQYRYVRAVIDLDTDVSIQETISLKQAVLYQSSEAKSTEDYAVRLEKFVFNNDQKYLVVLADEEVVIYENDKEISSIKATGLKARYFPLLKTAQKEDIIIFTHPDMPPKELRRSVDASGEALWTWGEFTLKNVPYYAFNGEQSTKKTIGLTPSEAEGAVVLTADSDVFSESLIGQYVDGGGGRFRITGYTSATKVSGYTIIPFYTTDKITEWTLLSGYEPAWSQSRGWPGTCLFAQGRLWFGGSRDRPATVFGSRVNLYNDFKNAGNYDNDAIVADLLTNSVIVNLAYNRGIHIFTSGEEWTVSEQNLTPESFRAVINTQNGSYPYVRSVVSGGQLLFVERNGRSLLSYVYDYNQSSYATDNLSLLSKLVEKPLSMDIEINSSRDKGDFVFMVLADGKMLIGTFSLAQDIRALSVFETDGVIKDVCSIKGDTYILVLRNNHYFVEKISDIYLDASFKLHVTTTEIDGLSLYEGKHIRVYSNAQDYGVHKVVDGRVTLSREPNEVCVIGMPFNSRYKSNYIEIGGQNAGIKKRISRAVVVTDKSKELTVNGVRKKYQNNGVFAFYGVTGYQESCNVTIESSAYPVYVKSITLDINYGG